MFYYHIDELTEKVIRELKNYYGEEVDVLNGIYCKNNGVKLHGITIKEKDQTIAPTFYIESFLDEYNEEKTVEEISNRIISLNRKYSTSKSVDMNFINTYEGVVNRLGFKLINRKMNEEYIEDMPFIQYLDLAIVFTISMDHDGFSDGIITVKNELLKMWGVSVNQIFSDAKKNMNATNPYIFGNILSFIDESGLVTKECHSDYKMYVLSNDKKCYGASAILYDNMLERIYTEMNEDYYILPSSVHELIAIPVSGCPQSVGELMNMVKEINSTQLEQQDILSNSIYIYSHATGTLSEALSV